MLTVPMRAICLMGPTASGKTGMAMQLAQDFPVAVINVDSAQVYRGMDTGTAKPSLAEQARVPHRLMDIRDPWEAYSAGAFCRDAAVAMTEITAGGQLPLLVGGTMLYFQALQRGLADLPAADPELRAQLDARAVQSGWGTLHAELAELDPLTASRLQPNDAQRIQRALEVCLLTGEPLSALQAATAPPVAAEYLNIGLIPADRQQLYARIEARLQTMLDEGFVAELKGLLALPGMGKDAPALRAVGYRQLRAYLEGACTLEDAVAEARVASRRLAKRQLTWLRSWPELYAVDSPDAGAYAQVAARIREWIDIVQVRQ